MVICPGAKPALFFPTLALVRPGDEVIYPDPGFPTYPAMIEVAGGVPVAVPLREVGPTSIRPGSFRQGNQPACTWMVILNSPSNPTGGILPPAALEHVASAAQDYDFWVLSDEIDDRLVYGVPNPEYRHAARHGGAHNHL